jgi:NAD(P)-dependent dehydrogenase (short-subunit alcohol dehydrogenase family)
MPPWALVTPSSRGIGLALSRRLLRTTNLSIVATTRTSLDETREIILRKSTNEEVSAAHGPSSAHGSGPDPEADNMQKEGDATRLIVLNLDVMKEDSIAEAAARCKDLFSSKDSHLHLAFPIPGLLHPERSPKDLNLANIEETFRLNTFSHFLFLKHFSPFLPKKSTKGLDDEDLYRGTSIGHATWAAMSARVGSTTDNTLGGWYSYRASKAAVNSLTRTFDRHLLASAGDKAMAITLHPGTVKTGLSKEFWGNVKEEKLFEKEFAARRLIDVVRAFGGKDGVERGRGKSWDWKGNEILP